MSGNGCSSVCGFCGRCTVESDRGADLERLPPKCRHLQDRASGYRWCEACGLELNPEHEPPEDDDVWSGGVNGNG